MITGAAVTYQAKDEAVAAADRVSELRHEISQERIAISLLKAEWSELTQPARLQELVERNPDVLNLAPYGVGQMVRITDIPLVPAAEPDPIADLLAGDG
jgi:hypothetical protein